MRNKKAEISITTLITTILLIVGFGILIFLFWRIGFSTMADREACYASVILRSTAPATFGIKGLVNLNCRTDKICITSGIIGGKCKEFENTPGVTTMRVSNEDQISKILTNAMFDCWTMMGEGKASIFSQYLAETYGYGLVYPSCVVCARVAFDSEGLAKAGLDSRKIDITKYMSTHYVPNREVTYSEYLAGETGKVSVSDEMFGDKSTTGQVVMSVTGHAEEEIPAELSEEQKAAAAIEADNKENAEALEIVKQFIETKPLDEAVKEEQPLNFEADTVAIIFMQISAPTAGEALKNLGTTALGLVGGASLASPSLLKPSSFGSFFRPSTYTSVLETGKAGGQFLPGGGRAGAGSTYVVTRTVTDKTSLLKSINPKLSGKSKAILAIAAVLGIAGQAGAAWDRSIAAGYCNDIEVGDDARTGCSVVRAVKYDPEDLNTYCSVIEGVG